MFARNIISEAYRESRTGDVNVTSTLRSFLPVSGALTRALLSLDSKRPFKTSRVKTSCALTRDEASGLLIEFCM